MIIAALLVACAALAWLAHRRWMVVVVRGGSMAPTLRDGQQLLVRRGRGYRRGDLVVFLPPRVAAPLDAAPAAPPHAPLDAAPAAPLGNAPEDPRYRIKRVAAVAGDTVPPWLTATGHRRVPPRHLAVSGDHPISEDSRHFGFVSIDAVLGYIPAAAPAAAAAAAAPPRDPDRSRSR